MLARNYSTAADVYDSDMDAAYDFDSTQIDDAVRAAGRKAFAETLSAGLPVFYINGEGLNVMERAPTGEDSRSAGCQAPVGGCAPLRAVCPFSR